MLDGRFRKVVKGNEGPRCSGVKQVNAARGSMLHFFMAAAFGSQSCTLISEVSLNKAEYSDTWKGERE